jgi:hypothetical protein
MIKSCSRCNRTEHIEKHHIKFRSRGGTNDTNNLMFLCKDCHDLLHSEASLNEYLIKAWKSLEYWCHRTERSRRKLNKIRYYSDRIVLTEKRLKVLKSLNSIENIRKSGYKSYWNDVSTHKVEKKK